MWYGEGLGSPPSGLGDAPPLDERHLDAWVERLGNVALRPPTLSEIRAYLPRVQGSGAFRIPEAPEPVVELPKDEPGVFRVGIPGVGPAPDYVPESQYNAAVELFYREQADKTFAQADEARAAARKAWGSRFTPLPFGALPSAALEPFPEGSL